MKGLKKTIKAVIDPDELPWYMAEGLGIMLHKPNIR